MREYAKKDYNDMVKSCEIYDELVNYLTKIGENMPNLVKYLRPIRPYEQYKLPKPYGIYRHFFIMADKNGVLKFVVGNRIDSLNDDVDKNFYLKYCYNLDGQLMSFIKECEDANFKCKLEAKRKEMIEKTIETYIKY